MKRILIALLVSLVLPVAVLAQNATMISMAQAELNKRGLNETEVRARLMENGIDVDNIQPADYPAYQSRVIQILDQMQAEKNEATGMGATTANIITDLGTTPLTTSSEKAAESALATEVAKAGDLSSDIYGHSLFTDKNLEVFRTTDGAQAPDTYILGEGDEVHISIFGSSQTEIHQRIGADGSIQPAGSTKIFLKGLTLEQGRKAIQNKLSQFFSFRPDQIAVTLSTARTVTVSIYGEVGVQGGFTMSALNTAFNALAAAGGPNPVGSVRNIKISRGGKASQLDLYKYMSGEAGTEISDIRNGDVIFVPIAQKVVSIEGAVNRPMRYEMIEGETLSDLINYAGGLSWNAYPNFVQIERVGDGGAVQYLEYNLADVTSGSKKVALRAGDVVRIKVTNQPVEEFITVNGAVYYPGNFNLEGKMTVAQAIEKAGGLKPSVFPVAYIFRKDLNNPDKLEYIKVDLASDGATQLQRGDALNVYDNTTYTNIGEVRVSGAVKIPFTTAFDPTLGIHDLLTMAGGFTDGAAFDRVEVFRLNISKKDEVKLELLTVEVDANYNPVKGDFQLQPYDNIVVRLTPNFTTGRSVEINGRVRYPGVYVLTDYKTQLSQIIEMAGGLSDDADPFAHIFRTFNNRGSIGFDFREIDKNKGTLTADPILMDGDVINIVRQENTVTIREAGTRMAQYVPAEFLMDQKTVVYQGAHSAAWYVRHYAGGFQKATDRNSVTVTLPNNQTIATKSFLGIRKYPTVEPGAVITMQVDPKKLEKIEKPKEKVDWNAEARNTLSALTSIVSVILLVDRLK